MEGSDFDGNGTERTIGFEGDRNGRGADPGFEADGNGMEAGSGFEADGNGMEVDPRFEDETEEDPDFEPPFDLEAEGNGADGRSGFELEERLGVKLSSLALNASGSVIGGRDLGSGLGWSELGGCGRDPLGAVAKNESIVVRC